MRNRYLEKYSSIIKVKIEGKNINNYLTKILKKKIQIIKLIPISHKEIHLIMKYKEYEKLKQIKTILYKTTIITYMGNLKIKKNIHKNLILIIFTSLGLLLLLILSKCIFSIEVIHQDKDIRNLIIKELNKNNIKKYQFKKTYQQLEKIEDKILKNNKDKLEWIEIKEIGTKYIIRVEERKLAKKKTKKHYQNIISKKEAIITSIKAKSGEKIKFINDYVKKGDIIIAGYITLPDNTKKKEIAEGEVLGEVWYTVKLDYPFIYQESKLTGKSKSIYVINFLKKRISILDFHKYKTFSTKNKILLHHPILNINFTKEKQYETKILDEVYTEDIAKNKAIDYIKRKLLKDNNDIKDIKEIKILTSSSDENSIKLKLFIKTIESIGETSKIDITTLDKKDEKTS